MINLFKTYNPLNAVWLAVLLIVLRIGYLFNAPSEIQFLFVEPFARLLIPVDYEFALSPFLNIFLAGLLVFLQALWFNRLVNSFNLMGRPSFLPALMYVVLTALFAPFLILSAPLICNFLVIGMLYRLLATYKMPDAKSVAYDMGMVVALGTLIYLPFIFMFLVVWAALIVFRPFSWREWVAAIIGFATIFFFLAVIYYLTDRLPDFEKIWLPLASKFPAHIQINSYNYLVLIPVAVILLLCFLKVSQLFFRSYVQTRKSFQLLLVLTVIAGLSFYTKKEFHLEHFLLCAVPLAVFFSYYFLYATSKWFYEGLFVLLTAGIIYFQFNTF
ncbi:DUF6427 family protein [Mucilaginibacter calamicampi]|uniref:DUF6427 family protein n=1 Tax=Mucilaginibacter calamicampi TaxID=1302352 RepID=A0ABW2Z266_9SPHI